MSVYSLNPRDSVSQSVSRSTSRRPTARPTTTATSVAAQDIICAVSESRGVSSTIGLAFVNLATAEAVLCQICDSQTYVKTIIKIGVFEPSEILFMNTAKESKLRYMIQENLPDPIFTFMDRRWWSEQTGHEYVDRLAFPEEVDSLKVTLGGNYFAACCFAAVLKYVEVELQRSFTTHSLRIRFEPSQGSMTIDLATIVSLELIQNLHNAKSKESLFGLLNETLTPMGARLLRASILQPSTERVKLTARYNAVEDLATKEDMFVSVRQALKGFMDADKVLTAIILVPTKRTIQYVEQSVNNVIMLKTYVSAIKNIFQALGAAQSDLLLTIRELCAPEGHRSIEELIVMTLNEHVAYQSKPLDLRNQRIYCVKAGVNSLLDVARHAYKEANADATELCDMVLDLKFDAARQYYICIPATEPGPLPNIFINVYRKRNCVECQTLDLVKLNQKITDSHSEVINMSDQTIQDLLRDVCTEVSGLFRVSEAIAMLDMLAAFAQLATNHEYIRPELTDTLAIKAGRHPIREQIHSSKFIPNDAYATPQTRFQVITGCNMSGKSTYIRTLALVTVMAQIGCFIPAQYASFPISHQLFARVATSDDLNANVSTFAAEMREMAFILRNIQPRSMVIIDELGRGTSTTDGLAIAIALAEALISSNALVWFVTHFHELAQILAERSGVINLHLAAEISSDASKMTMQYRIAEGPVPDRRYGLVLAKLADLPPAVLNKAHSVSEAMDQLAKRRNSPSRAVAIAQKRKLLLSLREQLFLARDGTMDNASLRALLIKLQDDFVLRMTAINREMELYPSDESETDAPTKSVSSFSVHTPETQALGSSEANKVMDSTHVSEPHCGRIEFA
ncbi:DNA mismatch repair protein Msh4, putative [Penicillium digitatum PHI26]|uniref:DNA mismatch repair protein Msh4, putative n=2 Tax=Penicillium digitatum TaxID=36651 RepID=K9G1F5_PEND2|nr:DNA mismatch repair protein Msh4, putative [Penicillium digitatum Pd1]EKV09805.1 DNA mismatch repair protein Msh4, putative [Penicillium digitatum Pd1]EKV15174.1 DNA mismatch repair protein Msh4, putative [Penicillium digitatum PHI26]